MKNKCVWEAFYPNRPGVCYKVSCNLVSVAALHNYRTVEWGNYEFCPFCGKKIEVKEGREWLIKESEKWLYIDEIKGVK